MCHEFAQLHPSIVNVCFNPGGLDQGTLSSMRNANKSLRQATCSLTFSAMFLVSANS